MKYDLVFEGGGIVDGGLLSNFPIELFISEAPQITKLMRPKKGNPVIGLLIDEKLPVTLSEGIFVRFNIKPGELQTVQRLRRLIDTATDAHDKMVIDEYSQLLARLPAHGYGTTKFDMSDERRAALVAGGRLAIAGYLDRLSSSAGSLEKFSKGVPTTESAADRIASAILR